MRRREQEIRRRRDEEGQEDRRRGQETLPTELAPAGLTRRPDAEGHELQLVRSQDRRRGAEEFVLALEPGVEARALGAALDVGENTHLLGLGELARDEETQSLLDVGAVRSHVPCPTQED